MSDAVQRHGLNKEAKEKKKGLRHVPFGYDSKDGKLVPNRQEQQVIRTARQLRAAGLTLRDIAAHLNRKLIPTKRGGVWASSMVHYLLRQEESASKKR